MAGGKVVISGGNAYLAAPIQMSSYHSLQGQGKGATTINLAASANCNAVETLATDVARYSIMVRDMTLDGNKDNNTAGGGVILYRAWYTHLENLIVKNFSDKGVAFELPGATLSQNACLFDIGIYNCENTGLELASGAVTDNTLSNVRIYSCGMVSGYNANLHGGRTQVFGLHTSTSPAGLVNVFIGPNADGMYLYGLMVGDTEAGATGVEIYASTSYNTGSQIFGGLISNSSETANTGYGLYVHGTVATSKKVEDLLVDGLRIENYDYSVQVGDAKCEDTLLRDCTLTGYATAPLSDAGTRTAYRNCTGLVDENKGTSSIASGATTATVTHGLFTTPTVINIVFAEQGTSDYGRWWISNVGTTTFQLNVSADPGASNLDFWWEAKVR